MLLNDFMNAIYIFICIFFSIDIFIVITPDYDIGYRLYIQLRAAYLRLMSDDQRSDDKTPTHNH